MIQISTDWHNLLLTLNQFVSQATQRSQEFAVFIEDINKLAIEISNLKSSVEREVDIEFPERDNQDFARRMIERRDMLEVSLCLAQFLKTSYTYAYNYQWLQFSCLYT